MGRERPGVAARIGRKDNSNGVADMGGEDKCYKGVGVGVAAGMRM